MSSTQLVKQAALLLLVFLFFAESSSAQQQGLPSEGKDFYIGFVYPSFNKNTGQAGRDFHGFFGAFALVSSYEDNNRVKFSYFDAGGNEVASVSKIIRARSAVQVPLDLASMKMTEPGDTAEYKACHITSQKPISVQYFSTGACSGGLYLALPTPGLGKNYVIASYYDNPDLGAGITSQQEQASGFFMIIAPFDGTNVTITPTSTTAGGHTGINCGRRADGQQHPYTVSLRRGQCYWVKGEGISAECDISGSTVVSNKPIAVLSGHEDAFIGDVGSRTLEGRNFMIQQLIPSESWDSTGYVSIPLKDGAGTQPGDAGYGENYRVYTNDIYGAAVRMSDCNVADKAMHDTKFAFPTPENNTGCAMEFHTIDGHKFGVMMYDLRDQGNGGALHPAEAMMSIVPMSHWKTSFLFYVPANTFEVLQNYYVNIIGLKRDLSAGNIRYSLNGGPLNRLTYLSPQGSYKVIPNHPELEGDRFGVSPGAYYFTNIRTKIDTLVPIDTMLQGAFMMYHYGMRAIDPDRDLGDFCGDDYFFSYASPVGMTLGSGIGSPTAKVDTLCASWHICVKDTGGIGIRSVTLLDDPNGNYYRPGEQFHNVHFDPALDPEDKKEIDFSGDNTTECFDVLVSNPFDSSYVPLYIVDSKGSHRVLELHYKAAQIHLTKSPDYPVKIDTLIYPITKIGAEVCSTLVYINDALSGEKSFNVNAINLKKNDGHFKIASVTPSLPLSLHPGDSLMVNVCFDAKDTGDFYDSLILRTDCFDAPLPIVGKGGVGIIKASDIDFGNVAIGTTLCKSLTIANIGTLPFILTENFLLHDAKKFSLGKFTPITIQPGDSITLLVCYSPTLLSGIDSTTIDWNTNIDAPYKNLIKSWSYLKGSPIKPGIIWDRQSQYFVPDSTGGVDSVVQRVWLLNTNTAMTHVDSVYIIGATKSEFYIRGDQLGYPLYDFNMFVGDSIWVDVVFKPDFSKPYHERFVTRIDSIVVSYLRPGATKDSSEYLKLIGVANKSGVKSALQSSPFTIRPNPMTSGKSISISFSIPADGKVNFSIFDVLGREVYHTASLDSHTVGGDLSLRESEISLSNLESGIYYVRLTAGKIVATQKLEIIK